MKKSDIAMIILIASISVLFAYLFMSQIPLFKDVNESVTIQTTTAISPTFKSGGQTTDENPIDKTIFSSQSINPTVKVTIGSDQGIQPDQSQGQ